MDLRPDFHQQEDVHGRQSSETGVFGRLWLAVQANWDLLVISALALAAAAIAITGLNHNSWLSMFGPLLALVLPGYALSAATLPVLQRVERLLLSLGLSLVIDVLSGLLLFFTPWGLRPDSWALSLGGITLIGVLVAGIRRGLVPSYSPPAWPKLETKSLVNLELTLAILLGTAYAASFGAQQQDVGFTQLWAVPTATRDAYTIQLGIGNQENAATTYSLSVESNKELIRRWDVIELDPDETWSVRLVLPANQALPIRVALFRSERPDEPYREAIISPSTLQ
ncbi:MAG: DUF1616 domain-containing protein, partial [Dehalococcoidia bacterium]|nr:DUF1616 domain-containing protein [Dehalococcoidia bacterium]